MKYKKVQDILPKEIIELIQGYIDGGYLYIPAKLDSKKAWGIESGLRKELDSRNEEIYKKYNEGMPVSYLSIDYYLSESSIRRIIREQRETK